MEEIWKDVGGYEGLYQVSNLGKIKSLQRYEKHKNSKILVKERILKGCFNKTGYHEARLYKNGIAYYESVHRLVAKEFISNPYNKPEVNHINGIKKDNRVGNLEWCTKKENGKHAVSIGLLTPPRRDRNVFEINNKGEIINEFSSIIDAARFYNIFSSGIQMVCSGKRNNVGGRIFRYAPERINEIIRKEYPLLADRIENKKSLRILKK